MLVRTLVLVVWRVELVLVLLVVDVVTSQTILSSESSEQSDCLQHERYLFCRSRWTPFFGMVPSGMHVL